MTRIPTDFDYVPFPEPWDSRPWIKAFLAVLAVSVFCIAFIDQPLALYLKANLPAHWYPPLTLITEVGQGFWWYALAILWWLYAKRRLAGATPQAGEKFHRWAHSAAFMFWAMALSGIVVVTAKVRIGRLRPRYLFEDGTYGFDPFNLSFGMNCFPSGHSQAIWSAMIALWFIFPKYRYHAVAVALIVSSTRFLLTVHYLGDVIMGAFVGIAVTAWAKSWFERKGPGVALD